MSMAGYILGLGDRHPSNLMLDRVSGRVVHIDFGESDALDECLPLINTTNGCLLLMNTTNGCLLLMDVCCWDDHDHDLTTDVTPF